MQSATTLNGEGTIKPWDQMEIYKNMELLIPEECKTSETTRSMAFLVASNISLEMDLPNQAPIREQPTFKASKTTFLSTSKDTSAVQKRTSGQ